MRIQFCPVRSDAQLTLEKTGEVLLVNGRPLDLGAATPKRPLARDSLGCDWLLSDVTRAGRTLNLVLALPQGAGAVYDDPAALVLKLDRDGPVRLPEGLMPPAPDDDLAPPV